MIHLFSPGNSRKGFDIALRATFHDHETSIHPTHLESDNVWVYYVFTSSTLMPKEINERIDMFLKYPEDIPSRMIIEIKDLLEDNISGAIQHRIFGGKEDSGSKDFLAKLKLAHTSNAERLGIVPPDVMSQITNEIGKC